MTSARELFGGSARRAVHLARSRLITLQERKSAAHYDVAELPIVLIHLGSRTPRYLRTCVAQIQVAPHQQPHGVTPRVAAAYRGDSLTQFRRSEGLSGLGLKRFWRYT